MEVIYQGLIGYLIEYPIYGIFFFLYFASLLNFIISIKCGANDGPKKKFDILLLGFVAFSVYFDVIYSCYL